MALLNGADAGLKQCKAVDVYAGHEQIKLSTRHCDLSILIIQKVVRCKIL